MIKRVHHIGIAVPDLDTSGDVWSALLGRPEEGREDVIPAATKVSFFPVDDTRFELLEGMGPETPVARFLSKRGPGIHHVCLEVDDIDAEVARLKGLGVRFTSEAPTEGAHGARTIFIHPKSTGGVLLELQQFDAEDHG